MGNVLAAVKDTVLRDFLNAAMQQVELVKSGENPITSVRMNQKYAFIELTSALDANKALNLYGIPFMGQTLVIKRPTNYKGPDTPAKTWNDLIEFSDGAYSSPSRSCHKMLSKYLLVIFLRIAQLIISKTFQLDSATS